MYLPQEDPPLAPLSLKQRIQAVGGGLSTAVGSVRGGPRARGVAFSEKGI